MLQSSTEINIMKLLNKYFLVNSVFLLSFFPFIKIIPFITAEVQPIAIIFASIYLIFFKKKNFPKLYVAYYVLMILIYLGVGLVKIIINSQPEVTISHILESTFILLSPLIIFLALFDNFYLISVQCLRFSLYSWFLISVLQQYFPSILATTGIASILSTIISRFSDEALGGSRGVAGFAPEPSYASFIIMLIFTFAIYFYKVRKINKRELKLMVCVCIVMTLLNRSASIFILFAIFFIFYNFTFLLENVKFALKNRRSIKNLLKLFLGISFLMISLIGLYLLTGMVNFLPQSRIFDLLSAFSSLSHHEQIGLSEILELTNSLGSERSISVYVGYFNAVDTYGIGSGIGSWGSNFLDALEKAGFNPSKIDFFIYNGFRNSKPFAYASLLAFDMGIIGLISLSMIFIASIIRRLRISPQITPYGWACLGLSIFMLYFNSMASLPTGWLILLLFLQEPKLEFTINSDI